MGKDTEDKPERKEGTKCWLPGLFITVLLAEKKNLTLGKKINTERVITTYYWSSALKHQD